jgi:hypothetical protein
MALLQFLPSRTPGVFQRLVCAGLLTAAGAVHAQSYPLVCKAGPTMKLVVGFNNGHNIASIYFKPSGQSAAAGVAPGFCAWSDRGWRQGEPTNLFIADAGHVVATFQNGAYSNVQFTRADIRNLEGITRNSGQTFVFQVRAQGNSMTVDRVGP